MKCEVCNEIDFKYKCPQCAVKTCSVSCVKAHKSKTGCSGVRNKTAYVAVKQFTDLNLLSDYRFLEDAARKADCGTRGAPHIGRFHNKNMNKLHLQAHKRNIKLELMPVGLSKRKANSTYYNHRLNCIFWYIEWIFPQSDAKYSVKKNDEKETIGDCIAKLMGEERGDPVVRQALKKYLLHPFSDYCYFMKVERQKANCARYHKINPDKSISDNLSGKVIIEHPTIFVVLSKFSSLYPVIDTESNTELSCQVDKSDAPGNNNEDTKNNDNTCQGEIEIDTHLNVPTD